LLPASGGGIVTMPTDDPEPERQRSYWGASVMVWLFVTAVGFLAVTALVMGLARSSTAEWEREKRLSRAPKRDAR
jgi:hypothetical protein